MRNGLQDSPQGLESYSHVEKMSREEEVVEIAHHGEGEVPERVEERVIGDGNTCLPHLVAPVDG